MIRAETTGEDFKKVALGMALNFSITCRGYRVCVCGWGEQVGRQEEACLEKEPRELEQS